MEMLRTVAKAWNIPDIRKKIIFTLLMLLIFRIGSQKVDARSIRI